MIAAKKNGIKRLFTEQIWQHMPPDCYGWEIVTDVPDAVSVKYSSPKYTTTEANLADYLPEKLQPTTISKRRKK